MNILQYSKKFYHLYRLTFTEGVIYTTQYRVAKSVFDVPEECGNTSTLNSIDLVCQEVYITIPVFNHLSIMLELENSIPVFFADLAGRPTLAILANDFNSAAQALRELAEKEKLEVHTIEQYATKSALVSRGLL